MQFSHMYLSVFFHSAHTQVCTHTYDPETTAEIQGYLSLSLFSLSLSLSLSIYIYIYM